MVTGPTVAPLQRTGFIVIVATDGVEALAKARQHKGVIPFLLSNVRMARMTEIAVATAPEDQTGNSNPAHIGYCRCDVGLETTLGVPDEAFMLSPQLPA